MKRRDFAIGSVCALLTLAFASVPGRAQVGANLDAFQWQDRILIIFAPIAQDPRLAAQRLRIQEEKSGFAERDLAIIEVIGQAVRVNGGGAQGLVASTMRARYSVEDNQFATVLIGKDGGEKLRRDGLMPTDTLFDTIDAMPMRRDEIRRNSGQQ